MCGEMIQRWLCCCFALCELWRQASAAKVRGFGLRSLLQWDVKSALTETKLKKEDALITGLNKSKKKRCPTVDEVMIGKDHSHTTIVTAYFQMESKYPSARYVKWMDNFFNLRAPMVVFTNVPTIILKAAAKKPGGAESLHLVETTLRNSTMYKKHWNTFEKTEDLDPERGLHPPMLYVRSHA